MPQSPNHPPFRFALERRHGDMVRADGGSAANEIIVLGGHVGTHVDALAHVSHDNKLFGGLDAASVQSHRGFSMLGIDEFVPYVGRAVYSERRRGARRADARRRATKSRSADLESALAAADVELSPGEAILIGTGWAQPLVGSGRVQRSDRRRARTRTGRRVSGWPNVRPWWSEPKRSPSSTSGPARVTRRCPSTASCSSSGASTSSKR